MQCSTRQCNTVHPVDLHCCVVQCSTVQCSAVQCSAARYCVIDINNISAFKSLKLGKASGVHRLAAEHFIIYAHDILYTILFILFTSFIAHGYCVYMCGIAAKRGICDLDVTGSRPLLVTRHTLCAVGQ